MQLTANWGWRIMRLRLPAQTLLIMRMLSFLLLGVCLHVSAETLSQSIKFSGKEVPLEEVFRTVEQQTGFVVFYNKQLLANAKPVSLSVKDMPLQNFLELALKEQPLSFNLAYRTVFISEKKSAPPLPEKIFVLEEPSSDISGQIIGPQGEAVSGATITIRGSTKTTFADGNGRFSLRDIPENAIVVISSVGFTPVALQIVNNQVKVVSAGRPATSEDQTPVNTNANAIVRADLNNLLIRLSRTVSVNQEVVVTGYQRIRKSEMVGSTSTVKREDLFYDGTITIEQMLQGKLPGMVVMNSNGLVGSRQRVRIRGTSTLLSNPEPVWVVDGIIQDDPVPFNVRDLGNMTDNFDMIRNFIGNAIAWLNPNDIEDITILKDASATVLYGVKAANGVIVITTKRGKDDGALTVNYSGGFAVSEKLNYKRMNLMNSKERIDVSRQMYEERILGGRATDVVGYEYALRRYLNKETSYEEFNDEVKYLETMNTDWMDILYRTPLSHNHSISLSGGSERVRYYSSFNYKQTSGIAKGNDNTSYGGSFTMDARVNKKLNVSARISGNLSSTDAFYQVDPFTYAIQTSRAIPAYGKNGDLFYYPISGNLMYNVLNELNETGNNNEQRSINTSVNLNYTFIPGLRFESAFGLSANNSVGEAYASENSYYISSIRGYNFGEYAYGTEPYRLSRLPHGGELNNTESHSTSLTWRNALSYNKVFGKHRFSTMAGEEIRSTLNKGRAAITYGYFPDRGKGISFPDQLILDNNGNTIANSLFSSMQPSITDRESNFLSLYESSTYSYDERFIATGSIRTDASNRFGQDKRNRFLPIWSAGVRWNVHNEPWMKKQTVLSELNIRATYGWQGNVAENFGPDLIAEIPANAVINPVTREYQMIIRSLPYGDLRWEKTKTINLGVDVGLFANRFTATLEYYQKQTSDLIIYRELPVDYGVSSMPINGGKMTNKGIELSVNGTLIRSRNTTWSLSVNTSKNLNRVNSAITPLNNWQTAVSGGFYKEGYAVSSFWAFEFAGLNPLNGYPLFNIPTSTDNPKIAADPTEYLKYMGTSDPDFTGGLSSVLRYKTFSLSASFNVSIGGKRFLNKLFGGAGNTTMGIFHLPSPYYNLSREYVDRWRRPGDELHTSIPTIPSLDAPGIQDPATLNLPPQDARLLYAYELYDNSDVRVVNASFLRCNNLSLSYNFTGYILHRLGLKNLAFTGSVSNPFILVSKEYKGIDPEVAAGNQPITRTFSLGFNLSL